MSQPVRAEFVISAAQPHQFPPDGLPEIALVGRSNVGKSSLINRLLGQPGLARTSSRPGRTQTLNFYRIWHPGAPAADPLCLFVDMPGYGFARVSKAQRQQWARLIEGYLQQRPVLAGIVQIVDFRHPPTAADLQMWDWLRHFNRPRVLVATKADKVGRARWVAHGTVVRQQAQLQADEQLVVFSAETGLGRDEVWRWLLDRVRAESITHESPGARE